MGAWIGCGVFLVAIGFFIHWLCGPGPHQSEVDDEDWTNDRTDWWGE